MQTARGVLEHFLLREPRALGHLLLLLAAQHACNVVVQHAVQDGSLGLVEPLPLGPLACPAAAGLRLACSDILTAKHARCCAGLWVVFIGHHLLEVMHVSWFCSYPGAEKVACSDDILRRAMDM